MDMRMRLGDVDLNGETFDSFAPEPFDYAAQRAMVDRAIAAERHEMRIRALWIAARVVLLLAVLAVAIYVTAAR